MRASFLAALKPYTFHSIKADKTCLSIQGTPFPVRNETNENLFTRTTLSDELLDGAAVSAHIRKLAGSCRMKRQQDEYGIMEVSYGISQ